MRRYPRLLNPRHKSPPARPLPALPPSHSQQLLRSDLLFRMPSTARLFGGWNDSTSRPRVGMPPRGSPDHPTQGQPRGPWDTRAPAHYSDTGVGETFRPNSGKSLCSLRTVCAQQVLVANSAPRSVDAAERRRISSPRPLGAGPGSWCTEGRTDVQHGRTGARAGAGLAHVGARAQIRQEMLPDLAGEPWGAASMFSAGRAALARGARRRGNDCCHLPSSVTHLGKQDS